MGATWNYSLIARVDDSLYTHGIDQTDYNINNFVKNNNNVARKNITLTSNSNPDPPIVIGKDGLDSLNSSLYMKKNCGIIIPGEEIKLKVYPNPTDGLLTIEYMLQEDSHVTTIVYDITGTIRQTLSQGKRNKGVVTEKYDMSTLRNGTYVVSVNINGEVYTNKIIKQ